jgi:hypothetical protein
MDGKEFSRTVLSWLQPDIVIRAADRAPQQEPGWDSEAALQFRGTVLNVSEEGGLIDAITHFLHHFAVPNSYLDVLNQMRPGELSAEGKRWLLGLQFEGRVLVPDGKPVTKDRPLVIVTERDAVADMLLDPINSLIEVVEMYNLTWKPASALGARMFLQHASPFEFLAFVERLVVSSYGFGWSPPEDDTQKTYTRYRAVNLVGRPPFDQRLVNVARRTMAFMASQTLEPIPEKRHRDLT